MVSSPPGAEEESEEEVVAQATNLPPGVTRQPDGSLIRMVPVRAGDEMREKVRPVALTLSKAKEMRWDYYHPELGWILEGYKLERDRDVQSIMADSSQSVPKRPK